MSSPAVYEPGFRLGKYEVISHIASGGMSSVYKARDTFLDRIVALKVLPPNLAENPRVLDRFRYEAKHIARLSHPNVVALYECGQDSDTELYYLVMEYIDGVNLEDHIERRGKMAPEEVRNVLIRVAKALRHAHEQGMVHRDIKPANILLAKVDDKITVKVTDLGLARVIDDEEFKLTREGSTVGTIDYMSPEQAKDSRAADIRSDIYSLGCTGYHMLTGRAPFGEGGLGERVYKHQHTAPPDPFPFCPTLSTEFWNIIEKMLAKKPADRYQTPVELIEDLRNVPAETSAPRKPARSAVVEAAFNAERTKAASLHQRALKEIAEGRDKEFAKQLLDNCIALEPFNIDFRKTLREFNRTHSAAGWFGALGSLAVKSKLKLARSSGNWLKVLELGEEILAKNPADVDAPIDMAEAAIKLNHPAMAVWLVEQAVPHGPKNLSVLRALAEAKEAHGDFAAAIAIWKKIGGLDPLDRVAPRKINELAAKKHLADGHYG